MSVINGPLAERITIILTDHPGMRDDDLKLAMRVWSEELVRFYRRGVDSLTFAEFKTAMLRGHISHFESIRRTRQAIQRLEANKHLRGHAYNQRHKRAEGVQQRIADKWYDKL